MKLQQLGLQFGTDKSLIHNFNNRTFLDNYEIFFKYLKDKSFSFLELGILNGSSLKVWENYFQHAQIVGLDIDPNKKQFETNRTKIYIGSQNDPTLIGRIKKDYPNKFAVILDDASHLNDLTIESFELLFEHVVPGGLYIIEDTHCTYGSPTFENDAKKWPGMSYNTPETNYKNDRQTFLNFILPKIQELDSKIGNIFAIHFYSETLIIEKTR
jgi:hypothetical protein